MVEDHYRLDRLQLESEGMLRLEVVSTDPLKYPISRFRLPHESRYAEDSYIITVFIKDGVFQQPIPLLLC